jgi:hypothetical protein
MITFHNFIHGLDFSLEHRHLFHSKNICPPPLPYFKKEEEGAYIFLMKQVPVL